MVVALISFCHVLKILGGLFAYLFIYLLIILNLYLATAWSSNENLTFSGFIIEFLKDVCAWVCMCGLSFG